MRLSGAASTTTQASVFPVSPGGSRLIFASEGCMIQARRPVTPTILSFRRAAISSAISAFSAEDKSRGARGNTKSSSILMCSLYRETRPAIAFRNASTFVDSKLSAAGYRCPKSFHLRVQRSGQKMEMCIRDSHYARPHHAFFRLRYDGPRKFQD